jgi:hypothetical protein
MSRADMDQLLLDPSRSHTRLSKILISSIIMILMNTIVILQIKLDELTIVYL